MSLLHVFTWPLEWQKEPGMGGVPQQGWEGEEGFAADHRRKPDCKDERTEASSVSSDVMENSVGLESIFIRLDLRFSRCQRRTSGSIIQ